MADAPVRFDPTRVTDFSLIAAEGEIVTILKRAVFSEVETPEGRKIEPSSAPAASFAMAPALAREYFETGIRTLDQQEAKLAEAKAAQ